jgi:hypothetical protein
MVTHSYTTVTVQPLVTLAAKKQCKVSDDLVYEDDLITEFNESAQASAENFINRSITERNFVMQCDKFETVTFERNYENDVISKIEYYAPGETTLTVLPADQYQLRKSNTIECFDVKFEYSATAVREDAVIITVAQGFTACPKPILQGIRPVYKCVCVSRRWEW